MDRGELPRRSRRGERLSRMADRRRAARDDCRAWVAGLRGTARDSGPGRGADRRAVDLGTTDVGDQARADRVGAGVPVTSPASAIAAVLLYRIATYYLPPAWGFPAMLWLQHNRYL